MCLYFTLKLIIHGIIQDCNFNMYFKTILSVGHLAHMNYLRVPNLPAYRSMSTCLSVCVIVLPWPSGCSLKHLGLEQSTPPGVRGVSVPII